MTELHVAQQESEEIFKPPTTKEMVDFIYKKYPPNFIKLFFQDVAEPEADKDRQLKLAAMQEYFYKMIMTDPDVSFGDLTTTLRNFNRLVSLDEHEFAIAQRMIVLYLQRHEKVKAVHEKFPDPKELFQALFGKKPLGKIEVIEGPLTLYFRCMNRMDYALIASMKFLTDDKDLDVDEFKQSTKSFGVFPRSFHWESWTGELNGLEGSIIAENSSITSSHYAAMTLIHEESHAIYNLFEKSLYLHKYDLSKPSFLDLFKLKDLSLPGYLETDAEEGYLGNARKEKNPQKKLDNVRHYLYSLKREEELQARDEFLAFYREGESPQAILEYLTTTKREGGRYDFFNRQRRKRVGTRVTSFTNVPENQVKELIELILFKSYRKTLLQAAQVLEDLESSGIPKARAYFLLMNTPLSRWSRVVKRGVEL